MANITSSIKNWSTTEASNQPDAGDTQSMVGDMRAIQAGVRYLYTQDTIASATTCDLGSKDAESLTISGTTTITGLGTVSAGIVKRCVFSGALTLTYNATSLLLPGNANIVTVAGDTAEFESLGSGNWRCNWYQRDSGNPLLLNAPPAIGGTTPAAGTFTTLNSTGAATLGDAAGDTHAVNGTFTVNTATLLGYGTGAGGAVTQLTSKSTAVTLDKPCGLITTHAENLAAGAIVTFTVNNSLVAVTDIPIPAFRSAPPTGADYNLWVSSVSAGAFSLTIQNISGSAAAQALSISFAIIKGVTA